MSAQPGIFALGTPEHCFLELDLPAGADPGELVAATAAAFTGLTTTHGVNVVVGLRPELWAALAPDGAPRGAAGWQRDLIGPDGFTMPATQHDAWVWVAGGDRTAVFDAGRLVVTALAGLAEVATETTGWLYRHDRDLTGFVDGTENPSLLAAAQVVCVPDGEPGAGGSVVLYQLWDHDQAAWEGLGTAAQERAMGRTKPDSVELDEADMPADAHVARTKLEVDGEELPIFRRNVAYGGITAHGTVFVGFAADQSRLTGMLRRMAGADDGVRDALTRYTTPRGGAYYVVPSVAALARFAPQDDG